MEDILAMIAITPDYNLQHHTMAPIIVAQLTHHPSSTIIHLVNDGQMMAPKHPETEESADSTPINTEQQYLIGIGRPQV